jgi:hypothetical protein
MTESIVPSGYFGTGPENIHIIENFLNDSLCDKIYNFALNEEIWKNSRKDQIEFWQNRVLSHNDFINTIFAKELTIKIIEFSEIITKKFNVEIKKIYHINIVRWKTGPGQGVHGDRENPDGTLQSENIRNHDISSIFYINDNFEGGELYFPQHNINIKPKKGMAVFFPGDKYYIHGIKDILSGTRITIPKFWTVDKII